MAQNKSAIDAQRVVRRIPNFTKFGCNSPDDFFAIDLVGQAAGNGTSRPALNVTRLKDVLRTPRRDGHDFAPMLRHNQQKAYQERSQQGPAVNCQQGYRGRNPRRLRIEPLKNAQRVMRASYAKAPRNMTCEKCPNSRAGTKTSPPLPLERAALPSRPWQLSTCNPYEPANAF